LARVCRRASARSRSSARRVQVRANSSNRSASERGEVRAAFSQAWAYSLHSFGEVAMLRKRPQRRLSSFKKKPRTQGVAGPLPVPMEWNLRWGDCPSLPLYLGPQYALSSTPAKQKPSRDGRPGFYVRWALAPLELGWGWANASVPRTSVQG
jgi:hypothetical protein